MNDEELLALAASVRQNSFSPYSGFAVGAVLLGENDVAYAGCNVESASYGLTMCAERVALGNAVSSGCTHFTTVVVMTAAEQLTPPCGACRQLLWEFAPSARVLLANTAGDVQEHTVASLLPHAFGASHLNSRS